MTRRIFVSSLLLLLFSLAGLAQDNSSGSKPTKPRGDRTFLEGKTVYGKLASIEAAKIVIENDYGAQKEIKMDTKTKFRNAKNKDFKLTDFTRGMLVKVTFREVDMTATLVQENVKK